MSQELAKPAKVTTSHGGNSTRAVTHVMSDGLHGVCCGFCQVIALCKSADLLLMVLDATKPCRKNEACSLHQQSCCNTWRKEMIT
jgi:hypothetical protein